MTDITPFSVSIPDSRVDNLKQRLLLATYPDELQDANWDLGTPLTDIQRLVSYWRDSFNWRKAESRLNTLPNFVTNIQCDGFEDLAIHFIHAKSDVKDAIPLLFVHGWPGSFLEVTKILEPLTRRSDKSQPSFHVVAPSLPNFGFSQGTKKRGFSQEQYAETCHKLMEKLGYKEYVTQGGDWGWSITRTISLLYPSHCRATHLNMDLADPPPFLLSEPDHMPPNPTAREQNGLLRSNWFWKEGFGYNLLQSTKPQTVGYALADSPVALLAWIYEKLHDWTDSYPWTNDEILTWVSVYWFSVAGPAASCRIYYEMMHDINGNHISDKGLNVNGKEVRTDKVTRGTLKRPQDNDVKVGQSHFPRDIIVLPSAWTRTLAHEKNMVFEKEHEGGGHFAAYERPEDIVADLREMFGRGGGAELCVNGCSGY